MLRNTQHVTRAVFPIDFFGERVSNASPTSLEEDGMPQNPENPATSILFIDGSKDQRTYWAAALKRCSADYEIVEASDGPSGLEIYRSRRIDCVLLELSLPNQSGILTLSALVPLPSRPRTPVIVLTEITHRGVWELVTQNGAYACLVKQFTTGEDLDRAIQRAMAFIARMPKEDRYRAV